MKHPYDLVFFDLDGTVLDTADDIRDSIAYVMRLCGYPERTKDEVRSFVGNGVRRLIQRSLPESVQNDPEKVEEAFAAYSAYYPLHASDKTKAFPGIEETLRLLNEKGVRCGVLSNKDDDTTKALIEKFYGGLFCTVHGKRPEFPRKPFPDALLALIKEQNVPLSRVAYVGDSEVDIRLAENAGVDGVIVSWGFRSHEQNAKNGAKYLADTPEELQRILLQTKKGE